MLLLCDYSILKRFSYYHTLFIIIHCSDVRAPITPTYHKDLFPGGARRKTGVGWCHHMGHAWVLLHHGKKTYFCIFIRDHFCATKKQCNCTQPLKRYKNPPCFNTFSHFLWYHGVSKAEVHFRFFFLPKQPLTTGGVPTGSKNTKF